MVTHARITTVTTLVQKIIGSTVSGTSSFVHDDGHLGLYPTSATLNHSEFQFKGLGLGMKFFVKCLTSRELPKLPVLSINNSARAIIIPKNVMHYIHNNGHFTLLTSHHVAWWSKEGFIDAWKGWRSQHLRPQPWTDVTAPKLWTYLDITSIWALFVESPLYAGYW